ncbi:AzlD domain-containing protein [Streptococcus cuniculipharyngis]|uniref:AzlD domain-containing protein n=1 Tax=Streptococcus cuniculipharyngis TaxID=1562651 RepID=A0A5C5SCI6_9STRE|nr:AzlD domain-containing protein [Streptococcus cuniculipharyngis]TWS97701.1 AzlD domain-containing protein [Streptococcus cuniculipharyngis]
MISSSVVSIILVAAGVTWLPRVLPFLLTQGKSLPTGVIKFLRFLPLTIIFALTLSSLVDEKIGRLPSFLLVESLAVVPTFWIVVKSKNILLAVLVGILSTAILRFFF